MQSIDSTIVDILCHYAEENPNKSAFIFLRDGELDEIGVTFSELAVQSQELAAFIRGHSNPGDRAILFYPSGLEFIVAFFACLRARVVPLAVYPPSPNAIRTHRSFSRVQHIAADADPTIGLTTHNIYSGLPRALEYVPRLKQLEWIISDDLRDGGPLSIEDDKPTAEDMAFLQYTSGSTSQPRGVVINHGNLIYNVRMLSESGGVGAEDVCVSWLPLFHDMGLICKLFHSVFAGIPCIFMSPENFIKRPIRWLQAITRFRGTFSGAPNFAYDLCARRATPEILDELDLSSWAVAFNSSEPVRAATIERFCSAFGPAGFSPLAMHPGYGLAEATVVVSGGTRKSAVVARSFSKNSLASGKAEPAHEGDSDSQILVSSGTTLLEQEIVIADPKTSTKLDERHIGEIWVRGSNVSEGYFGRDPETEPSFNGRLPDDSGKPWLRTGDLGFLDDGNLFVSGRIKDIIIVGGRNHYPQDLELTVEAAHPRIRPGCSAAFAFDTENETEVVVVAEIRVRASDPLRPTKETRTAIRKAVATDHGLSLADIVLISPGALPKTTSGKVQRYLCRKLYEDNQLEPLTDAGSDEAPWRKSS